MPCWMPTLMTLPTCNSRTLIYLMITLLTILTKSTMHYTTYNTNYTSFGNIAAYSVWAGIQIDKFFPKDLLKENPKGMEDFIEGVNMVFNSVDVAYPESRMKLLYLLANDGILINTIKFATDPQSGDEDLTERLETIYNEWDNDIQNKFVKFVTGEVLGQRPMSQRRDAMNIIERDAGLKGLILRPLSAKMFEPTISEKTGLVDREKLLDIKGRSRKPQIQLARELHINDYPCPAGGCLLTDQGFANRMRDLMKHKPDFTLNDVQLLKIGRHFRLSPDTKLVVGRDKEENSKLSKLSQTEDVSFYPTKIKGPVGIGKGKFTRDSIFIASSIIARYSDGEADQQLEIAYRQLANNNVEYIMAKSADEQKLASLRI